MSEEENRAANLDLTSPFDDEGKKEETAESEDGETGTYPSDCYTFMAIHGPFDKGYFFYFGFLVWAFQITFLLLLVLRVAHPKLSTNENEDNPDMGLRDGFMLANFVPSNNNNLSRATQYMALASYCFFADASVKDVVTAVETFPRFSRARAGDRPHLIAFSCVLRMFQGFLATIVVFLLVINTSDVIDIILNFTAVNFISDLDDVAFELCRWGKYGPKLKAEADRIETLPVPPCIYRKYQHVRYRYTVVPLGIALFSSLLVISLTQDSLESWVTTRLRIQFKDDPLREDFNGCYDYVMRQNKRILFESYQANAQHAKFGYCQDNKKWFLFKGNKTSACDTPESDVIAFSSKTYSFDISTVFEDTWYSPTGTPLELYFFDDQKNELSDDECDSFLGDGICDAAFNIFDHSFDNGDCCGTTCESYNCGIYNTLSESFNTNVSSGNGYANCIDPEMKPITIELHNFYLPIERDFNVTVKKEDILEGFPPIDPLLQLDCDGKNLLMITINRQMASENETVWVSDGSECTLSVTNITGGLRKLQYVNYTVYHGDAQSIENSPIVIFTADSSDESIHNFQRIPDCFFPKLKDHVDIQTIYTGNEPSNNAIKWLVTDSKGYSNCEDDAFLERYALATLNFAAPVHQPIDWSEIDWSEIDWSDPNFNFAAPVNQTIDWSDLWIAPTSQCAWPYVLCIDGRVSELDLGSRLTKFELEGTIPTEIGLMERLTWLDLGSNKFKGSIPSEIGEWQSLKYFAAPRNELTGTIPSEIANLQDLDYLLVAFNQLTGSIPSEIGKMSTLRGLILSVNRLVGLIPNEIEGLSSLEYLLLEANGLEGTIPTILGALARLKRVQINGNRFSGAIPSEFGSLEDLDTLLLAGNILTSVPTELFDRSFDRFEIQTNNFTNLSPVEGMVICPNIPDYDDNNENYCNCNRDCTFNWISCECEEAQKCCNEYMESNSYTQCLVCPRERLVDSDKILEEYMSTCVDLFYYIANDVTQFGNEESCSTTGKTFFEGLGCACYYDSEEEALFKDRCIDTSTEDWKACVELWVDCGIDDEGEYLLVEKECGDYEMTLLAEKEGWYGSEENHGEQDGHHYDEDEWHEDEEHNDDIDEWHEDEEHHDEQNDHHDDEDEWHEDEEGNDDEAHHEDTIDV